MTFIQRLILFGILTLVGFFIIRRWVGPTEPSKTLLFALIVAFFGILLSYLFFPDAGLSSSTVSFP